MAAGFDPRQCRVRPPEPEAIPWSLLQSGDPCPERRAGYVRDGLMRVAWQDGEAVAVYVLLAREVTRHELMNLAVREDRRGCGLGRWMLRHALAVGESRGARRVEAVARGPEALGFLERNGFRRVGTAEPGGALRLRFELPPE